MSQSLISSARQRFHESVVESGILSVDSDGLASNADKDSKASIEIASGVAQQLHAHTQRKLAGQTLGAKFEEKIMHFLSDTFPKMQNLRPGVWQIVKTGNRSAVKTHGFAQYDHLADISKKISEDPELHAALGNAYMIAPDIVIYREPVPDAVINTSQPIVDDSAATFTALRAKYNQFPILHASVSAKWTMRSDRAQNSRTEALGLVRNRKGSLPHIVVVTGEPLPSRLASLALGTGDIDCMYHFALYELVDAVNKIDNEEAAHILNVLIKGNRLKDISDLPLDLCV